MNTTAGHKDATAQGVLSDISDSAREAFRRGKSDAYTAVEKSLPSIKLSIAKGVYVSCYYLAFGAVFGGKLALELVPEHSIIREGIKQGAAAANEAYARRLTSHGEPTRTTPAETAPSAAGN